MELIIGNFQFSLFLRNSIFLKKIDINPKNIPMDIDIRKGLNNLEYPLPSTMVLSKKSIEMIGASFWLPGEINQTPVSNAKIIIAATSPKNFDEKSL